MLSEQDNEVIMFLGKRQEVELDGEMACENIVWIKPAVDGLVVYLNMHNQMKDTHTAAEKHYD